MRTLLAGLFLAALVGCKRDAKPDDGETDAGPGNYQQLGPVGLAVESARNGKVRGQDMFGRDGESEVEVFTVRLRLKLLDDSQVVKQPPLQRDGMLMFGGGAKLWDESGREFKPFAAGGFGRAVGRRTKDAILNQAENGEVTDVLTFESVAAATGDLVLEIPANYQLQQPNDAFLQTTDPGTFRFRIPRGMWEAPLPTTEAGPGNWATVGPVSVAVEGVKVGKLKMRGIGGVGESKEPVFAVTVRVKLTDPRVRVKKPPYIPNGSMLFYSPAVSLKPPTEDTIPAVGGFGLDRFVDRLGEVELTPEKPEVIDVLTFDVKAATADELILTLWPKWQERKPDGTWADTSPEGEFRFRLKKSLWEK